MSEFDNWAKDIARVIGSGGTYVPGSKAKHESASQDEDDYHAEDWESDDDDDDD